MPEPIMKALATITDPDSATTDAGGFTAVLSTPSLDRDGDQLNRDEWVEPLPDRITLDVDHEMSVQGTIGSARPYFDDDGRLMIDATFASTPKAQEVRTLIREGHVNSVSVAFMTDRSKKDGTARRELLNAGVVAIPSNRDAVILASKGIAAVELANAGVLTEAEMRNRLGLKAGARNSAADTRLLQAAHDALVLIGAECASEAAPDAGSGADEGANKSISSLIVGKSLTGSVEDLRDRLSDALQDVAGDGCWIWVRATFLDTGGNSGTVVYDLGEETYSRTFTDENGLITLGGTLECVTFVTSVAPAPAQVDADPSDAVEGSADEHDEDDEPEMRSLTPSGGVSNLPALQGEPVHSPKALEAFKSALDALTKTSGNASPDTSDPAEPPTAPDEGTTAGKATDEDEEKAQKTAADMLAGLFSAQVTLSTLEH